METQRVGLTKTRRMERQRNVTDSRPQNITKKIKRTLKHNICRKIFHRTTW